MKKTCPRCSREFPRTAEFWHRNRTKKDGLSYYCKECRIQHTRKWQAENVEEYKESQRETQLRIKYGLSVDQYRSMLENQGGSCAICGDECPTGNRLAVDHCHETGEVRGLLCVNCNHALGNMKDDPALLRRAAQYLEEA